MIFAYIDPGAGSLLIQAVIAAAVSVPFFFRNAIRKAVRRVRGEAETPSDPPAGDAAPE